MKQILIFISIFISLNTIGQNKSQIQLVHADKLKLTSYKGQKAQQLRGNVIFKHDGTTMYCDSAYFYNGVNNIDAFGQVHINDRDSLHLYGKLLKYDGNLGLAELYNDVTMQDTKMTLKTEHIYYNTKTKIGYYLNKGVIITDENKLTSDVGYYYELSKTFVFQKKVVLQNPKYVITSDTLSYNTATETAFFNGPTKITSNENYIYCEKGWYNTKTNISRFQKHTFLKNKSQKLYSDSLFYDRNREFCQAYKNVILTDSVNNIILKGNFAEYYQEIGKSFFTDSSLAIIVIDKKDSLYIHADTLRLIFDSTKQASVFMAYKKAKFFKSDIQGKCDSMVYIVKDSVFIMNEKPVVWSNNSQISAKKIRVCLQNGKIRTVYLDTNAFMLQKDSVEYFNQVSGRNMISYFKNNTLDYIDVIGNAQSIYFARDDNKSLIGVNLGKAGKIKAIFNSDGVSNILYLQKPKASLNPINKVSKRALYLRGFKNYDKLRPKNKDEVFIW